MVEEERGEVHPVVLPVAGEAQAGERGEGGEEVEGGGERGGDACCVVQFVVMDG